MALTGINLGLGILSVVEFFAISQKLRGGSIKLDDMEYIASMGATLGAINGIKYTCILGISNEFAGDYANEAKMGGTLAINTIAGIICGYNSGSLSIALQSGFASGGALTFMDAISFGVESYIDSQESVEFNNLQVV